MDDDKLHLNMRNYKQLANSNDWRIRDRAATDENCPIDILCKLILDRSYFVCQDVRYNISTPKELINAYNDLRWMIDGYNLFSRAWFINPCHLNYIIE